MEYPKTIEGETRESFIDRVMKEEIMVKEFPNSDQRLEKGLELYADKVTLELTSQLDKFLEE